MTSMLRTAAFALILALGAPPAFAQQPPPSNLVSGSASATTTSSTTIIAAPTATRRLYITSVQCSRTDAGTTAITVALNDDVATTFALPNSGGGGGSNLVFVSPLTVPTATALKFAMSTNTSSVFCSAQGFSGN